MLLTLPLTKVIESFVRHYAALGFDRVLCGPQWSVTRVSAAKQLPMRSLRCVKLCQPMSAVQQVCRSLRLYLDDPGDSAADVLQKSGWVGTLTLWLCWGGPAQLPWVPNMRGESPILQADQVGTCAILTSTLVLPLDHPSALDTG